MAKDKSKTALDGDGAIDRARATRAHLKPKDEPLYWASLAQALLLREMRDIMREGRTSRGSVRLPEQAPPRETARVTVVED